MPSATRPSSRTSAVSHAKRSIALEGRSEIDLVADLVYEFPARVLFLLMGIPAEDAPRIKQWADYRLLMTFGDLSPAEQRRGAEDMVAYWRYCVDLVADRKLRPRDDYASFLIANRAGAEPALSDNEIVSLVFGLLLAGHETTTNLSANALLALLSHRASWEAICADPSLIPNAIEEVLRTASSVVCWRRRAREATTVRGVDDPGRRQHPAGARLRQLRRSAVSPSPTVSTSAAQTRASTSPSARARTSASAHR